MNRYIGRYVAVVAVLAALGSVIGCNKKDDDVIQTYTPDSSVAISSFSLGSNDQVAKNLDQLFFSIDLERGLIFNADSLPVGANVTALVPKMSYSSTVGSAVLNYQTADGTAVSSDFVVSPNVAIDFTHPVSLVLTSADGLSSRTYTVKVNVHKTDPSKLGWGDKAVYRLPSRLGAPVEQKTVRLGSTALSMMKESDGTVTVARCSDLYTSELAQDPAWEKVRVNLPFEPRIGSLAVSGASLFMLATDGRLWTSADASEWRDTGETWESIIGPYSEGVLLGVRIKDGRRYHVAWPADSGIPESEVSSAFPVSGYSNSGLYSNKWSSRPMALICGGRLADGSLSTDTWAFDGRSWTWLSGNAQPGALPALEGASLVPYWISTESTSSWKLVEHDAWLIMGGRLEDGSLNRDVWYSLNNGVSWIKGGEEMSIPEEMPLFYGADNIVSAVRFTSDALAWQKKARKRINASIEGTDIVWECPYIFVFGGYGADGRLLDSVWRGAINRQRFVPVL